jgi:hypothetical protein
VSPIIQICRKPTLVLMLATVIVGTGAESRTDGKRDQLIHPGVVRCIQSVAGPTASDRRVVIPGKQAGELSLGDPETRVFELFPKSAIGRGSVTTFPGTEYIIGLLSDARRPGFLRVFVKDGKVVEIEASGSAFHTVEGIASKSSPEDVRLHYEGMKSYLYLGGTSEALNSGPLVIWTDKKDGIAFSFALPQRGSKKLVVSTIIVFMPDSVVWEEDTIVSDARSWRELAPYSLGSTSGDQHAVFTVGVLSALFR